MKKYYSPVIDFYEYDLYCLAVISSVDYDNENDDYIGEWGW